jgi:hypothetical protein
MKTLFEIITPAKAKELLREKLTSAKINPIMNMTGYV